MANKEHKSRIGQEVSQVTPLATQAEHVPQFGQTTDRRLATLVADLSVAEKDAIKTKLGVTEGAVLYPKSAVIRQPNTGITITIRNDSWTTYTNLGVWSQPSGLADLTTNDCMVSWETSDVFTTPYQCKINKFKYSFYSSSSGNVVRWAIGIRDFVTGSFDASVLNPSIIWTSPDQTTTGGVVYYKEADLSTITIPINKQVILMGFDAQGGALVTKQLQRVGFQFEIEEIL